MENDTLLVEFCSGERKEPVVLGETEELWKVSFGGSGVWVRKDDPCIIGFHSPIRSSKQSGVGV